MSEERDRRLKELFERVLDAPEGEREAIIGSAGVRPSLQGDVRELVRAESELGDFLETPAAQRILEAQPEETPLEPGDQVAEFTVVGVLGRGGGGVVYEAEQRDPRRRVALKLIRTRPGGADARAFREEAASLARLNHAGIAHVYSAGVRDTGGRAQPWIAMERIGGATDIVRHAREAGLSRDDRIRLFVTACDAIHHAHQKGVIHRDVKPGNVLVDAEGRPKVVDFGVACSVSDDGRGAAGAVGTLAYASPEQLAGDGRAVDVRADVYGLGVLLFELLTSSVPHDVDDLTVAEAARRKRDDPVAAPSARAPGIPPDLDAIVLCALRADASGRYDSAAALAADLRRFLANEPVAAYRGGTRYQFGKFVRRRRAVAVAIAAVAAALLAGTTVSVWFAVANAAARDHSERRSYVAEIAAAASALRLGDIAEARRRLDRAPVALRDWEWRHLASRLDGSRETVRFEGRELWGGAASADGKLLAVSGVDRRATDGVRFVALARKDGTIVREWTVPGADVPTSAVSHDGLVFAAGFADGRVLVHDVASGRDLATAPAHAARVIAVAFAPDDERFATASADGTARLRSSRDGAVLRTFEHPDWVICLAFDATGERLVTGCRDGSIRVWDAGTGERIRELSGHEGSVEGVSVSPDGARLASVSRDQTVRLWNLADGAPVAVGRSHSSNVRDVAFDPRGGSYVSASWDGTLRVWDARTGAETGLLRGHGAAVNAVAFTGTEPRLVSFSWDGTVKRWDPARTDVATCRDLRDQVEGLAFDPDGTRLAVAAHDGSLTILDAATARATARVEIPGATLAGRRVPRFPPRRGAPATARTRDLGTPGGRRHAGARAPDRAPCRHPQDDERGPRRCRRLGERHAGVHRSAHGHGQGDAESTGRRRRDRLRRSRRDRRRLARRQRRLLPVRRRLAHGPSRPERHPVRRLRPRRGAHRHGVGGRGGACAARVGPDHAARARRPFRRRVPGGVPAGRPAHRDGVARPDGAPLGRRGRRERARAARARVPGDARRGQPRRPSHRDRVRDVGRSQDHRQGLGRSAVAALTRARTSRSG